MLGILQPETLQKWIRSQTLHPWTQSFYLKSIDLNILENLFIYLFIFGYGNT